MFKSSRLVDEYSFPGFRPKAHIKGKESDPGGRVIVLERRQKKEPPADTAAGSTTVITTASSSIYAICLAAIPGYTSRSRCAGFFASGAAR